MSTRGSLTREAGRSPSTDRRRMLTARFRGVPFIRHLGMRLDALGDGAATVSIAAKPALYQYQGLVHGGVISSLADTAATFAILTRLPDKTDVVTIEFKMNFLAPLKRGRVTAVAHTLRLGRRVAVAEVRIIQKGECDPAGVGIFSMLVFPVA